MFSQAERDNQVKAIISFISLPQGVSIRPWQDADFQSIQKLSSAEGWPTPEQRPDEASVAWRHSWPALVATDEGNNIVGFIRALSDTEVTTYIADFLVAPSHRQRGIGRALLDACHHLFPRTRFDLLSMDSATQFYESNGFRRFPGFRKNY